LVQLATTYLNEEAELPLRFGSFPSAVTLQAHTSVKLNQLNAFVGLRTQPGIILRTDPNLTLAQALLEIVMADHSRKIQA
jgi:hypothetical protein